MGLGFVDVERARAEVRHVTPPLPVVMVRGRSRGRRRGRGRR